MRLSILAALAAATLTLAAPASHAMAVDIGFDSLSGGPFTSGSEDGFDLSATNGRIVPLGALVTGFSESNYFVGEITGASTTLTIKETDGSAFIFSGFDYVLNGDPGTPRTVTIRGFQNSDVVASDAVTGEGSAALVASSFLASNLANVALTMLTIEFTAGNAWAPFIDNIALNTDATLTPIPLPGAAWLLLGGLGGFGLLGAARRKGAA